MVCGPEIARCVSQFEASLPYYQQENEFEYKHHEQTSSRYTWLLSSYVFSTIIVSFIYSLDCFFQDWYMELIYIYSTF